MSPPSFIRPVAVNNSSPFLGDLCALCKQPFTADDRLVICPQDGSRHHQECWEANGNHCTAYGCEGQGEVVENHERVVARAPIPNASQTRTMGRFSKVRTLPSSSMGCAQTCLVISIALAIILIGAGCFGLWAVADYILVEVLDWPYRDPFGSSAASSLFIASLRDLFLIYML